jgi:hypothetical protein
MSETLTITPSKENNDGKKNLAAKAATIATGVAAGVVGSTIVSNLNNDDDAIADVIETPEEITDQAEVNSEAEPAQAETEPADNEIVEPEPITNTNPEPVVEEPTPSPNESNTPTNQPVNPDDIADAIIAEDQVDPKDIDMANVINFDKIDTVYYIDGESHTAATFHDNDGNQLTMVDVDDDGVFDIICDESAKTYANIPDHEKITVDDAQLGIANEGTYLAHDNSSHTSDVGEDSIEHDLIS